jgi:hypothetical protein
MTAATATATRRAMQEVRYTRRICDLGKGYLSLSPCTDGNESCGYPKRERRVAARSSAYKRAGRIQGSGKGEKNGRPRVWEGKTGQVNLPALAGSDKDGARLEFKRVVALLCRQVQVEGRVGCRPRCLRKEGWWRYGGGRLHGGEVERVRVHEVRRGRLGRSGVEHCRRAEWRRQSGRK